jgi:hypothetical protein
LTEIARTSTNKFLPVAAGRSTSTNSNFGGCDFGPGLKKPSAFIVFEVKWPRLSFLL